MTSGGALLLLKNTLEELHHFGRETILQFHSTGERQCIILV